MHDTDTRVILVLTSSHIYKQVILSYDQEISFDCDENSITHQNHNITNFVFYHCSKYEYGFRPIKIFSKIRLRTDFFIEQNSKLLEENLIFANLMHKAKLSIDHFHKNKIFYICLDEDKKLFLKEQLAELEQAFVSNCVIL